MTTAPTIARFELSTPKILAAVIETVKRHKPALSGKHLDIGSGNGELIRSIKRNFRVASAACDYTDQIMRLPGQKVDVVDLNSERLPYPDAEFDLITMTEVVEHIEQDRRIFREASRILKPDGLFVVTTPNILNLKSRLRFLFFGFWNLFGPLPVTGRDNYKVGGHINPISYFYLAHALREAGFKSIFLKIDKAQKTSVAFLIFLYLPVKLVGWLVFMMEVRKYRTIDEGNAAIVKAMNSVPVLVGRTIIVTATKT
jgi:ubiquinone/menaquinone biosynthesis C-methylase UbiE